MARVLYLDGWRGLAIISVFFGHFIYSKGINFGRFGVELFFVLSGRLMAEILFVRSCELKTFYWRRISRIYPALVLFVILVSIFLIIINKPVDPILFLSAITLTYNYVQIYIPNNLFIDHIWSLCIEEHSYLIMGLIAFASRRTNISPVIVCFILAAFGMLWGIYLSGKQIPYDDLYWRTDVRGASIFAGAAFYLSVRAHPPRNGIAPWIAPILVPISILCNMSAFPDSFKYTVGTLLLAYAMACLDLAHPRVKNLLSSKFLTEAGTISYSAYLWQQPFVVLGGTPLGRLLGLAPAIAAAYASFFMVERPARQFLNKLRPGHTESSVIRSDQATDPHQ